MGKREYTFGKAVEGWRSDKAQTVTFIVTEDCNLRCKYCYVTHKSANKRMNLQTAKKFVDYLLTSDDLRYAEAIILEFIGGEPFLEAELIDQICDYFKITAFRLNHDWYWNYRISICTNGVNYSSPAVQNFINKNMNKISVTISLDGTKEKHDLQRVFPDGSGSYDIIDKNVDLWLSQFKGTTKATFASQDLPLLYESIISLWKRGIKEVNSNVVFENVWKDGDDEILEEQLIKLADYVIENQLYDKGYYCSFFDETIGFPYTKEDMDRTYCGAGKMVSFNPSGNIYPCLRYYSHSLNNHKEWVLGNLEEGVDMEKVRPFVLSTYRIQSDEECLNCEIATGCAFCQGFNYDEAPIPTNFYRAKYICKMHKARVRANDYYFSKLFNLFGIERSNGSNFKKQLFFLLSDDYVTYCSYKNESQTGNIMKEEEILNGLRFARQNFYRPVFVHSNNSFNFKNYEKYLDYDILHIVPAKFYKYAKQIGLKRILPVYNLESIKVLDSLQENIILNVHSDEIKELTEAVKVIFKNCDRINLNITGLNKDFNEEEYRFQMKEISEFLIDELENHGVLKEINVLTDTIFIDKHDNCTAGEDAFVISPQGKIYTCCAQYSNYPEESIGDLNKGIFKDYLKRLYDIKNSNLCRICDAYQCKNCRYINKLYTNEINVSPSFQCRKSHIERDISIDILEKLKPLSEKIELPYLREIKRLDYLDPIYKFSNNVGNFIGYYKFKK